MDILTLQLTPAQADAIMGRLAGNEHRFELRYPVFGCSMASDVNPREWLTDVLTRIPFYNHDYSPDLADLLFLNWKVTHEILKKPMEIQ